MQMPHLSKFMSVVVSFALLSVFAFVSDAAAKGDLANLDVEAIQTPTATQVVATASNFNSRSKRVATWTLSLVQDGETVEAVSFASADFPYSYAFDADPATTYQVVLEASARRRGGKVVFSTSTEVTTPGILEPATIPPPTWEYDFDLQRVSAVSGELGEPDGVTATYTVGYFADFCAPGDFPVPGLFCDLAGRGSQTFTADEVAAGATYAGGVDQSADGAVVVKQFDADGNLLAETLFQPPCDDWPFANPERCGTFVPIVAPTWTYNADGTVASVTVLQGPPDDSDRLDISIWDSSNCGDQLDCNGELVEYVFGDGGDAVYAFDPGITSATIIVYKLANYDFSTIAVETQRYTS